jgi:RHS repeat-associated protein
MRLIAARSGEMHKTPVTTIAAGLIVLLGSVAAQGQYALTYSSVPAGGGRSTGGTYALLTAVGAYTKLDDSSTAQAPTPNPMQWATTPYAPGRSTIAMMAAEASDPSGGVQYYFQNVTVSNGSHDSGWQDSRTYIDHNLDPNTVYEYRVRARGFIRVETGYSVQLPAKTHEDFGDAPEGSAEPVSGELGNDLSLQVDPFTGSVGYSLPIVLPPARQGSEPALALRYGGGGNGWCGVGWSLGMGAIQRDTRKGVPVARSGATFQNKYDDAKGFTVAFGEANSRLVLVNQTTHEYRAETDQAFLKYEYNAAYDPNGLWTVTDKSGNRFFFGRVAGESAGRPAGAAMKHPQFNSTSKGENVFLWALAKIEDISGNLTYIYYTQDGNQLYLDEIRYNGHTHGPFGTTHSVQFVREDREDKLISYATGCRVETNKRLKEIQVKVFDKINTPNQWIRVRSYHLTYENSPSTLRSLLKSVKMCGTGNPTDPTSYLPPVTFDYQQKPFEFDSTTDWGPLDSQLTDVSWNSPVATNAEQFSRQYNFPDGNNTTIPFDFDDTYTALCDLNGDALPDKVLRSITGYTPPNNTFKVLFNTGSGFTQPQNWGAVDAQGHTSGSQSHLWNSPRAAWTDIYTGEPMNVWERINGHNVWVPAHYEWIDGEEVWVPGQYVWIPTHYEYNYHFDYQQAQEIPVDLVDINGDGLADRVMRKAGSNFIAPANSIFKVQLNSGSGFNATTTWGPLYAFGHTVCDTDTYDDWDLRAKAYNSLGATYNDTDDAHFITLVSLADMNCDGLMDRVLYEYGQTIGHFKIQFNSGSGFENSDGSPTVVTWGPVSSQGASAPVWYCPRATGADDYHATISDLVDINGDGLPDRLMRKISGPLTSFVIQFNTGQGFEKDAVSGNPILREWGPISGQGSSDPYWTALQAKYNGNDSFFVDFFDINGDGLPDRVMREWSTSYGEDPYTYDSLVVQLNTGSGFQKTGTNTPLLVNWTGIDTQGTNHPNWASPHGVYRSHHENSSTYVTMSDINGDGLPDRVMRKAFAPYTVFKVQLNKGPFPDLLSRVKGKLGGSVQVTYKSSADPTKHKDNAGINRLPFPVQVASSVDVNDGFGNHVLTQYEYSRGFFNATRKEFAGFGVTTVKEVKNGPSGIEDAGTTTKTYFHQGGGYDDPDSGEWQDAGSAGKKGMPYRVEVYGRDGNLYKLIVNKVEEVEVVPDTDWHFAYVAQTTMIDFCGVAVGLSGHAYNYGARCQEWQYDTTTGNLIRSADFGEVDLGRDGLEIRENIEDHTYVDVTDDDDVYMHHEYATLDNPAILNRIRITTATSDPNGAYPVAQTFYTYDPNGRIESEILWLDRDKDGPTEVNDCNTAPLQYAYDEYGSQIQSIDRVGIETITTYDSNYHTFPIETAIENFITSTEFDILTGLPVKTVDPAGMVAENVYDSFYRLIDVYVSPGPNLSATIWQTHLDYELNGIAGGTSYNRVHQVHTGYEAYIYNDGLGRIVQTRVKDITSTPQRYRVAATAFDELGRVRFQTLPFFNNGEAFTSAAGQPGTLTEYDTLGRVWKVTPPAGEAGSPTNYITTTYESGTTGNPWKQIFTDAEGKVTRRYSDAAGRIIQIVEVTSTGDVTTTYEYDRLGRLIATVDNAGNEFLAEYDSLGRKIRSIDPDMGEWTYLYDDAGRMVEQQDASGNRIELSYDDEIGRMSQKVARNNAGVVKETITYTYDASDDPDFTVHKGQTFKVTDGQGWTKSGYDSRGRAIKSSRYVSATNQTYTTHTAYDDAGRVTQIVYPGNKALIAHSYDSVGHLVKVESLWGTGADVVFYRASNFNEDDQPTVINYGNGASTQTQFYTAPRRLKRTYTSAPGGAIQDITYTYDKISNIKSVADGVHSGVQSCGLSTIVYDDLHRLTRLTSAAQGLITYEYTPLGNINKNGEMGTGTYTYSPTKPHAVTAANGSTYAYDACGNMTNRNRSGQANQTLTYDEQNRLKQVAITGGSTVQFGYSAGGSRIWKKVNGQVTGLWIGSLYEEKDGQILCHVYAGGRLVASFEPEGGFACFIQHHPFFAAVWNFGDGVSTALFGGGRTPMTIMWTAALTGIALGIRYNRRKLLNRHGLQTYYGLRFIGGTDPWRQMVLLTMAASVFLSSNPQAAYAGTPVYDPVFYYYHPDHLGSSQLMTDRDGDVVQQYGYTPFGKENYKNNTYAFSVSSRYTGQTLDEETGLYYYGARYYDPKLARFIQADSIVPTLGFSQAFNRYAYCYNNPLRLIDPTGYCATAADAGTWDFSGISSGGSGSIGVYGLDWGWSGNIGVYGLDWGGGTTFASTSGGSTALTFSLIGNPSWGEFGGGGGGHFGRYSGYGGGWSDTGTSSREKYSDFSFNGATEFDRAWYIISLAGAQTGANIGQSIQDTAIGVANAFRPDLLKWLGVEFPSPQWAKDRFVPQSNFSYVVEKISWSAAITWGAGGTLKAATAGRATLATGSVPNGSFSIRDWSGYPKGLPRPQGPFRLLEGAEYDAARSAANAANRTMHQADPALKGLQIHEIQPVKFAGSPTDPANRIPLTPQVHTQYNVWWNRLMKDIKGN